MKVFETEQEKKSLLITTISFALLFLLFFYLKFSNNLPLPELDGGGGGGEIAVNFGNSDFGSGDNIQSKEIVTVAPKEIAATPTTEKEILFSENEKAPAIVEVKKPATKIVKTEVEKPVVKPIPKPSKSTSDALSNLLNSSNSKGADGDDGVAGNKGKINGNTKASGYNGGGGTGDGYGPGKGPGTGPGNGIGNGGGSGGGYMLGNRKVLSKPFPNYVCNEVGSVVVQITVDQSGNVIDAKPGVKGTTNAAKCLLEESKNAAMNTKWQSDNNAPDKQIGKIIYVFKLN